MLAQSYANLGGLLPPAQLEEAERLVRLSLRLAEESGDQRLCRRRFDMGCLMLNKANPEAEQWLRRALADGKNWEPSRLAPREWPPAPCHNWAIPWSPPGSLKKPPKPTAEAGHLAGTDKGLPVGPRVSEECALDYMRLGISLVTAGQAAEADIAFQKASESAPQDASLHNEPGLAFGHLPPDAKLRDPGRAVQLAKRAVELAPNESAYWNTLGAAQYRAGELEQARVEALKKSMELRTGGYTSNDWFFLAMAHWQLGDKDEARKWYDQAVEWMEKNQPQERGTPPLPGGGGGTVEDH